MSPGPWWGSSSSGSRCPIVPDKAPADLRLKIFASVLGVDRGETLVGIPALLAPVANLPTPEIALFEWVRDRGHSEVQIFASDARSGRFLDVAPAGVGRAKYDEFTILLMISFTVDDLDAPAGSGRS